jgi:glycosyltransferase involved in cell wall biosynthesis
VSSPAQSKTDALASPPPARVCMHVLGIARTDARVLREAASLVAAGLTVSIIDIEDRRDVPREEPLRGIRLIHLRAPGWFVPTRFKPWFLVKALQILCWGTLTLLRTPADVYHAQDMTALPACYIAARLRRKPLIFDAHELPLVEPAVTRWRRLHALATKAFKFMLPGCKTVITVSPPIAQEIQRRFGGPEPVLIRNIPEYQPPVSSDRLRHHLELSADARIALYQGNLQVDRGLDRLISAAKFLDPGIVLVLMGRNAMGDELPTLIAKEHVADRVKVLPPVPYDELLEWTASADVGLIIYARSHSLNVQMCLPNKLFEYLMAGVPVLASSLDAVADLLQTYDVGRVVPSLEPEAIGQAISALVSDNTLLTHMSEHALAAAQRELRWDVESQRLVQVYHRMLDGSGKSASLQSFQKNRSSDEIAGKDFSS